MRAPRIRTATAAAVLAVLVGGTVIAIATTGATNDTATTDMATNSATTASEGGAETSASASPTTEVELEPIVAAWPEQYAVLGSKSEPLYTERISFSRDGDLFALRIEVIAQGDSPLGTQRGLVRVEADGGVAWVAGCTKDAAACADDPALRGFLSTAALLGLERSGRLPQTGTSRDLYGTPVVCVADDAVHPDAAPSTAGLDPCFSVATGALLGHWSDASAAFVGPTLAAGFTESEDVDVALFAEVLTEPSDSASSDSTP